MTTSLLDNLKFRVTQFTNGRSTESIEIAFGGGGENCSVNVQPPQNHAPRFPSSSAGHSLNMTPTNSSNFNFPASQQPVGKNSELLCELNSTPQSFNNDGWQRSQPADFASRPITPPPSSYRTARERSMTPIQYRTGRERSISPLPAEITAIGYRSEHSIPEISDSFAPLTPRPSLTRPTLPMDPISRSATCLVKNEAVNHGQQEQPRASTTTPDASVYKNEFVSSGVRKIPTTAKAEPLNFQSSANTLSNWNPNGNSENRTERLYDHVSQLVIHASVDGNPLTSEQEFRARTRHPNAQIQIMEIWQDGKPLYRNLSNTSTRH
ncbi:hypothetical protein M3Y98_00526600 [Aphelenchoides besseyi]|nr:hypothetical protein M3Y98_00526600 [Aphelenchoides besseyi]KAI6207999.1 hypothetical protein M3Y96_00068200 [Aphelenchoides besseyi]